MQHQNYTQTSGYFDSLLLGTKVSRNCAV